MVKEKKEVQERGRSCPHEYAPKTRLNKNHILPPRTSHEVFHALFLLQRKLPREIAVRVLDAAGFWIWEAIECRSLDWKEMFISDSIRQRSYAMLRCLVLAIEYKTDEQASEACLRHNWEAVLEPQEDSLGTQHGQLKFEEPYFQLLDEVVERRGRFSRSLRKPIMQDLKADINETGRLNFQWMVRSVCCKRTGHCVHMLYALI